MGKQYTDLSGQKFNKLTVIRLDHKKQQYNKQGKPNGSTYYYLCKCECGNEVVVCSSALTRGTTKSCGCLVREKVIEFNKRTKVKHGFRKTRLYQEWRSMKGRCMYTCVNGYKNYGGRGISICDEWKNNFESFKDWALLNGYTDKLTLDRIDADGNYCPENCRWVTPIEQGRNRRNNHLITYNNETHCLSEWAEILGIDKNILYKRISSAGWSVERAFTEPVHEEKKTRSKN